MQVPTSRRFPSLLWPSAGLLLVACGGGGGGGSPAPTPASVSGTLRMPQVAPARLQPEFDAAQPMVAGEVVVWIDAGEVPPDLRDQGLELLRASGGPIAIYEPVAARGRASFQMGGPLVGSAEQETCTAAGIAAVQPGVRCASPNYLLQPCVEPNDTYYNLQWHYPQINLPQAWNITTGSTSVIVAVIDTGIVSAHPEFTGRLIAGYDMISNAATARDGNGRDPNPEDVGDLATPQGSSFHGTHVSGTIGANGNDGSGVAGIDWNCKIMPIRALGQGGGSIDDIANAILFAARLSNGSGTLPAQRADVVNMSLGGPGVNSVLQQACDQASAAGVLLVAAAGNDNSATPGSPASFDSVLSVGAVDLVKARAPYSNFSTTIDLWAPGGDMSQDRNGDGYPDGVLSTTADDQGQLFFKFENGTSMASPHVAGVAALCKAANPSLTAAQIRTILLNSAGNGNGLPNGGKVLDALAAVQQAVGGSTGTTPVLVATPSAVDFGATGTTTTITLENRGGSSLVENSESLNPAAPWLGGQLADVTASNGIDLDQLTLTVDRTGLPDGVYQTTLTLEYLDGPTSVTIDIGVRMQVGASTTANDTVFILLVDPLTLDTKYQTQTDNLASFTYSLGGLSIGDYILVAGTDRDNDDFLGDEGELFGAWPNLDSPLVITLASGENVSGLEFGLVETSTVLSTGGTPRPTYRRLR